MKRKEIKIINQLEDKLNELNAEALQAKLMGDEKREKEIKELIQQLEAKQNEVLLDGLDENGRMISLPHSSSSSSSESHRSYEPRKRGNKKMKKQQRKEGESYYEDDEEQRDLKTLISREKEQTSYNYYKDFVHMMSSHGIKDNDMEDIAPPKGRFDLKYKGNTQERERRMQHRAINAYQKHDQLMKTCVYCYKNKRFPKHLILSLGNKVYLTMPFSGKMMKNHVCIVPLEHEISSLEIDEEVWNEINNFKKSLVRMFRHLKKEVIFVETVSNVKRKFHLVIDCLPLDGKDAQVAPAYFKKGILDSEDEWSVHKAKSVIDTNQRGGFRNSVPKGFNYFYVDFAGGGGYAHVIDDRKDFPQSFAREIMAGILELEPENWKRKKKGNFEEEKNCVLEFLNVWDKFDWTAKLDGGNY